jgi:hypothetical protein
MIEIISFDGRHRKIQGRVAKNARQTSKKYEAESQKMLSNNIDISISKDIDNQNNNIDNKDIEWFMSKYNEICVSFPKVKSLTEKRKKAIRKILKSYSDDDIIEMFINAESSDFLKGKNDRGWKANIDFMLREDKFVNILEGQYNGKKYKQNVSRDIEHLYGGIAPRAKKGGNRSDKY